VADNRSTAENLTDGRAARWAGQRAKRRAEIIDAAIAAIDEYGPTVSTEQIATHAGIARPRLYRHFEDSDDLHRSVAMRAAELVLQEMTPLLSEVTGSPAHIIDQLVRTLVRWLAEHANLYQYLTQRAVDEPQRGRDVLADVRTTIGQQLSKLLGAYLRLFTLDIPIADPLAFGFVGFVESTTHRWLTEPGELTREQLIDYLSAWIWGTLDHILRTQGVTLDPDQPLELPADWTG
jgi:AcrR family transcriptional regulator